MQLLTIFFLWVQTTLGQKIFNVTLLNNFILDVVFDKLSIGLHCLLNPTHLWNTKMIKEKKLSHL